MNHEIRVGEQLTGLVAETRKGMFINNADTNPLTISSVVLEKKESCLAAVPLISKKSVLGVLTLTRIEENPFTQEDYEFLELFSASAAGIIDNAMLVSKLSNANEQLEDILNKTHIGLFMLEDAKTISFVNETFTNFLGYKNDDLVNISMVDIIVEDDFDLFKTLQMSVMFSEDSKEIRFLKKNGESITLELHLAIIAQEGKSRVLGTAIDVTEKQMLTEKLLNQRTKQNLELVSSSLIHDIKNILVGVSGPVSIIKEKYKHDESLLDYTNLIQENLEYIILKTKEYLNPNIKLDESLVFEVNSVFNDSINQLSHVLGEQIEFDSQLSHHPILLKGPKEQFYTSILNLLYNSRDAMPTGGKITISTSTLKSDSLPTEFSDTEIEDWAEIKVCDTGSGIPEDVLDKIFISHFSTKKESSGTGLGLSMVKNTIENEFNGKIAVQSKVGVGTVFSFYIPVQLERESDEEQIAISNQKLNIVIIDDEQYILDITQELLEVLGHKVTTFTNLKMAEEFILSDEQPQIVIIDRNLDKERGEVFFENVNPHCPNVKFILASGYINSKEKQHLLNMGFAGVIEKPFDLKTINQVFQNVLS
jgi:PAS domain S-box-containing protein